MDVDVPQCQVEKALQLSSFTVDNVVIFIIIIKDQRNWRRFQSMRDEDEPLLDARGLVTLR